MTYRICSYAGAVIEIRRALAADALAVARVARISRVAAMPWLPSLHTPQEDAAFYSREVETSTGWVAVDDDPVVGFALVRSGWLNHLYVLPAHHGRGIGRALVTAVLPSVGSLSLWVFERNVAARAFYRHLGFEEIERTDGHGNEEREPDVLMRSVNSISARS